MTAISLSRGFGDYALPQGQTFAQMQCFAKVQKIALALFHSLLAFFSSLLFTVSLPIGLLVTTTSSYFTFKSILSAIGVYYRSPPMNELFPKEVVARLPALGETSPQTCSGFATCNGIESHEWKLNLIRAAKHNIFISGCYAGGKALEEVLDLIRERMRQLPSLSASILSSNVFITSQNRKQIGEMEKEFGNRFSCVIVPEVFPYTSPTTGVGGLSSNHTKAVIIDWGAAFMTGGTGIVTPWTKNKGDKEPIQSENFGVLYDHVLKMKSFRDGDFVFQSPQLNGIGTRFFVEMTKLFERLRNREPKPLFTPWPERVEIHIPMPRKTNQLKLAAYATGPDAGNTSFAKEIVSQVKKAKTSILIGHMYFHPTREILRALIDAAKRGVKITLITNKNTGKSPGSHLTYCDLSRYYANQIPNMDLYEFTVPYTTYHKKVIIIDNKITLNGSTNLGKKSLTGIDYEFNLKVESAEFATATAQLLEEDKLLCKKETNLSTSWTTSLNSSLQSLFIPFL